MKSYDYEACAYDGAIYCNQCLPEGITVDSEKVSPVFADSEWDGYPTCDSCGEVHDYVQLTREGITIEVERSGIEVFFVPASDFLNADPQTWMEEYMAGEDCEDESEREESAKGFEGFYWWSCQPGCLPDGDPNGPFKTREDAEDDAMGF